MTIDSMPMRVFGYIIPFGMYQTRSYSRWILMMIVDSSMVCRYSIALPSLAPRLLNYHYISRRQKSTVSSPCIRTTFFCRLLSIRIVIIIIPPALVSMQRRRQHTPGMVWIRTTISLFIISFHRESYKSLNLPHALALATLYWYTYIDYRWSHNESIWI